MRIPSPLASEFSYFRRLLSAGLDAATPFQGDAPDQSPARPEWGDAARRAWVPALIGTAVGMSAVCIAFRGKSRRDTLVGALVGGAVGFGGGVAWSSRDATTTLVKHAAKNIGVVRNDHWLEKHPICYG